MSTGMVIFVAAAIRGVISETWKRRKRRIAARKGEVLPPDTPSVPMKMARRPKPF